jgi:hypothetical protein
MLVPENSILLDTYFMGPGKGSRQELRCESLDYSKCLEGSDGRSILKARHLALAELQDIAFRKFREGAYHFEPPKKHELATSLVKLNDVELIDLVFDVDEFVRDIVIRELTYRGRFDREIYRIGEYGNELARSAAIAIFKERILSNASCPKQRDE